MRKNVVSAYFLLSAIGLLIFFTITFTFSFKDKVFQTFFQRPLSFAQEANYVPKVELIAQLGNSFKAKVFNIDKGKQSIILKWKTEESPTSCTGSFWSNVKKSDEWAGPKNVKGGDFTITDDFQTGIYIYSINCANEYGDSLGSSIVINVGAKRNNLQPHLVSFQVRDREGNLIDTAQPKQIIKNTNLRISWSAMNTDTFYGICVASGSWPTVYRDMGRSQVNETFTLDKAKIYQYQILCSNEYGYNQHKVSFVVK